MCFFFFFFFFSDNFGNDEQAIDLFQTTKAESKLYAVRGL